MGELTSDIIFSSLSIDACCNRANVVGDEWHSDKRCAEDIDAKRRAKHGAVDRFTALLEFWVPKKRSMVNKTIDIACVVPPRP